MVHMDAAAHPAEPARPAHPPASDVLTHVGANLRRHRGAAGLSQAALADRSGVSRRTIIKLEAGEANISLSGLDRLAEALGVTFVDLVAAPAASRTELDEVAWRGAGADSVGVLRASVPARQETQLWGWTLGPGDRYDAQPDPDGWHEMVLVTEGRVRIEREDGRTDLEAGQHSLYSSAQHYAYVNIGTTTARFARIVVS
jgi:transcriptional regulator with XRE-family HTH domain